MDWKIARFRVGSESQLTEPKLYRVTRLAVFPFKNHCNQNESAELANLLSEFGRF
jgi:TolB-like protein